MATPVEGSGSETTPVEEVQVQSENTPGPNPNWEPVLNLLPESFHGVVTPHFAEWDKAANSRIESLSSQFEPYKVFAEHGISREDLEQGIRLANVLNEQPQVLYEALAQQLGVNNTKPEATPETPPTGEENYNLPPDYEKLQQGVELIAQRMLAAEQAKKDAEEQTQLNTQLADAEKKYGKFNDALFMPFLHSALNNPDMTVDKAAAAFAEIMGQSEQQTLAKQPYAPNLLGGNSGGGAGLPSQAIDVTKLNRAETKNLVVEYLKRSANQPS